MRKVFFFSTVNIYLLCFSLILSFLPQLQHQPTRVFHQYRLSVSFYPTLFNEQRSLHHKSELYTKNFKFKGTMVRGGIVGLMLLGHNKSNNVLFSFPMLEMMSEAKRLQIK